MNITWYGLSCFKIEEKVNGNLVTVVTDPFNNSVGLRLPKLRADIVSVSHSHSDHNNSAAVEGIAEKPAFVIDRPGEYEIGGVSIFGIGSFHDKSEGAERGKSIMFKFDFGGLSVLHLGDLGTLLSDPQLERLDEVDILLVPVGGRFTINAKEAAEVVRQIEPRIVIPMHYQLPGLQFELDGCEKFRKEMGNKAEMIPKLKISKKDIPSDETKLIILEKD